MWCILQIHHCFVNCNSTHTNQSLRVLFHIGIVKSLKRWKYSHKRHLALYFLTKHRIQSFIIQPCRCNQLVMLPSALTGPEVTDTRSSPDPLPVFPQQPAGLLQWQSGRHHRSADVEAAGCPECSCLPDCWHQTVRSCQSYRPTVRPALVASQTKHHFQTLHFGLQVSPRHGHTISVRVCLHRHRPVVHGCTHLQWMHSSCHGLAHATETVTSS